MVNKRANGDFKKYYDSVNSIPKYSKYYIIIGREHINKCLISKTTESELNDQHFLVRASYNDNYRKRGNCECIATWGRPTSRQYITALFMTPYKVWSRSTCPFPYSGRPTGMSDSDGLNKRYWTFFYFTFLSAAQRTAIKCTPGVRS